MRRAVLAACAAATAFVAAGCASAEPPPRPRQPYKVVLLPVEGAEGALAAAPEPTEDGEGVLVPLALTPAELESAIFEGVRKSNAFSELIAAPPDVAKASAGAEDLSAAADFARRANADLILRITVKSARIRDLGNNDATFWSTLAWFMIPAPVWFSDDRTYETNVSVEAALFEPRDTVKPTASVVASSGQQELDLFDRGLSAYVILVPPPWIEGDPRKVSAAVTERAVGQLMDVLVEELRTREIPTRFDLALAFEAGELRIEVAGRRMLRSLEVFVDGKRREAWAETDLVPEKDSTDERRIYRRTVAIAGAAAVAKSAPPAPGAKPSATQPSAQPATQGAKAPATTEVRVVAEDEAGGREVRTIVLGRSE